MPSMAVIPKHHKKVEEKHMKKFLSILLVLTMVLALAACGGSSTAETEAPKAEAPAATEAPAAEAPAAEAGSIVVGFAQVGHESDWRTANTKNYQDVFSAENGYDLIFVDCDNDNAVQIESVRTSIQQGVDYIILAPIQSAGWESVLQEAKDAGIPVIVADRQVDADASMYDAFIGTDTEVEGKLTGDWLAEYLNGAEANILVIEGSIGASAAIGRTNGFNSVAEQHDEWTILDSQSGDFTQTGGQEVMESFIKSYNGQFNVVVCQNDNEAYGAMDAMDAAGITYGIGGDVIIISFDATHDGLKYTLEGKIHCNVECNPIQAEYVDTIIKQMEAGEEFATYTLVEDSAFVAPGIESQYATTMTQEVLDGRAY